VAAGNPPAATLMVGDVCYVKSSCSRFLNKRWTLIFCEFFGVQPVI
jgi:hypothetical protein